MKYTFNHKKENDLWTNWQQSTCPDEPFYAYDVYGWYFEQVS